MLVIVADAEYDAWLTGTPEQALALLKPYPAEEMRVYAVSARVNSPKNDVPELVAELDQPTPDQEV